MQGVRVQQAQGVDDHCDLTVAARWLLALALVNTAEAPKMLFIDAGEAHRRGDEMMGRFFRALHTGAGPGGTWHPRIRCLTFGGMERHVIKTHRQNHHHHNHHNHHNVSRLER